MTNKLLSSTTPTVTIPNYTPLLAFTQQVSLLAAAAAMQLPIQGLGLGLRNFSTSTTSYKTGDHLTHTTNEGKATMVHVGDKTPTKRVARAQATIHVGTKIYQLITENQIKKGDVLTVAQIAGIMAAKKTPELIPLCHNILISSANVDLRLSDNCKDVVIEATVNCEGKTGVEMEALTAVSVAALTVYDMCKAVSHEMVIKDIRLIQKRGGKSDFLATDQSSPIKPNYEKVEKIVDSDPFSPAYV